MCEIAVYSNISRGIKFYEDKFLGIITVNYDDDIQEVREKIRQMIINPPEKIDLKLILMKVVRNSGDISFMIKNSYNPSDILTVMESSPPYSLLHSNETYTIRQFIDNTPISYTNELNNWLSLEPLERPLFIAVDYNKITSRL
jgi:hypothetical protein